MVPFANNFGRDDVVRNHAGDFLFLTLAIDFVSLDQRLHDVLTADDATENRMLSVEMRSRDEGEEKLRTGRLRDARIGHAHIALKMMSGLGQFKLIENRVPRVPRQLVGAVAASLRHESGNHAVEIVVGVEPALHEINEIADRIRGLVFEQLQFNSTLGCFQSHSRQRLASSILVKKLLFPVVLLLQLRQGAVQLLGLFRHVRNQMPIGGSKLRRRSELVAGNCGDRIA